MSHKVKQIQENDFDAEVRQSSKPVLVDFFTAWCGPCRMLAPILEDLAGDFEGRVKFVKVDADQNMDLAQSLNVHAYPTMLLFKDGEVVDQIIGVRMKDSLAATLERYAQASSV